MKTKERFDLNGKVAIITGSSKGIGLAIARGLAENGAKVIISSRKPDAVEIVASSLRDEGLDALGIACHVGDGEQRENLVKQTMDACGRIDILVNNAAINPFFGGLEDTSEAVFDKIMDVNVKAPWALSNLVHPHMEAGGGGSIINISSVEGLHPGFRLGLYSMTKAALIMLTKNQAKEWGSSGIRANAVCPGLVKTKLSQGLWANEKMLEHYNNMIPLQRMAEPVEMAGLVMLLASDAGSYMTGGVYAADGGYLISG